ncbi:MAG TPA: hypothetical protein VM054_07890 [bacterium]|nr:hypothetical protein [bacterium]
MNDTPLRLIPLFAALVLSAACREDAPPLIHPVAPADDLADRVTAPGSEPGDRVTVGGLLHDTGALTTLTSYTWNSSGITREVYFLEPRRPELTDALVRLSDALVSETGVYGYGVRLSGGAASADTTAVPPVELPEAWLERLGELDLDALSAHPEHNGNFRPTPADFVSLTWRAVDWTGEGDDRRWLLEASRLPLPPFADPRLERWLQIFAEVNSTGTVEQLWIGVRGSFLE